MKLNIVTLLFCTVTLSACALGHRLYVPPKGENVAHLRVVDALGQGVPATVFISTFEQPENCKRRWFMQGAASSLKQTDVTLSYMNIEAGKPFALAVNVPMGGSIVTGVEFCAPIVYFEPEAGRFYTATIAADTKKNLCFLSLLSANAAGVTPTHDVPTKRMIFSNGFDENSSFCRPE